MKRRGYGLSGVACLVIFAFLIGGCASTTMIHSTPEGAKVVFEDAGKSGVTPYQYSDSKILYATTRIKLEKEGYKTLRTSIKKDGTLNVGALVGACFVGIPGLWLFGYEEQYNFELESAKP